MIRMAIIVATLMLAAATQSQAAKVHHCTSSVTGKYVSHAYSVKHPETTQCFKRKPR